MTEEQFWQLIASTRGNAEAVTKRLSRLSPEEIRDFHRIYWEKHNALHRWEVWQAADLICGGCGDDSFHYFKAFVIGKGQEFYEIVLQNPDDMGDRLTEDDEEEGYDNELLNYAAVEAYEAVAPGQELDHLSDEGKEPSGPQIAESDAPTRFPKLWASYGD